MDGFYKTNNAVLNFNDSQIDEIRFNHYISRKENIQRIKGGLPRGQFYFSYPVAERDLNMSRCKLQRIVKEFTDLGIISIIETFPKHMRKPSIYGYLTVINEYKNDYENSNQNSNQSNNQISNQNSNQSNNQISNQNSNQKQRISKVSQVSSSNQNSNQSNNQDSNQNNNSKKELLKRTIKKNIKKENNTSSSSDDGNSNSSISKKEIEQQIEALWKAYPNKKGKATAIKKLPKLIKQYGYEQLARCVDRYKTECTLKNTELQYIKHGDTFFNGAYMDYLDENYQIVDGNPNDNAFDEMSYQERMDKMKLEEHRKIMEKAGPQRYYSNGTPIPMNLLGEYIAEDGSCDPYNSNEIPPDPF